MSRPIPSRLAWLSTVATLGLVGAAAAQDRAELDPTRVLGHRELPKVLTIVPWKKPLPGSLTGRPLQGVLDEALAPVDREVFRRQLDYSRQLQPPRAANAADAAAAPAAATPAAATPAAAPPAASRAAPG